MTAVIIFCLSFLALFGFLFLKEWEVRTNRRILNGARVKADALVISYAQYAGIHAPEFRSDFVKHLLRELTHMASLFLLRILHIFERRLLGVVNMIKGKGTLHRGDSVSTFLREVSEHKQGNRGQIFE